MKPSHAYMYSECKKRSRLQPLTNSPLLYSAIKSSGYNSMHGTFVYQHTKLVISPVHYIISMWLFLCRFTASFGIHTLLDPFLVFVVDMLLLRYNAPQPMSPTADVTKLYWHFQQLEQSGITGIFLTLLLYALISIINLACFYVYFLQVHMNGRLSDTYHRLRSPEEEFFLPMDNEISQEELGYICRKSEQWRGNEGQRKKVMVTDYIWKSDKVMRRAAMCHGVLFAAFYNVATQFDCRSRKSLYTSSLQCCHQRRGLNVFGGWCVEQFFSSRNDNMHYVWRVLTLARDRLYFSL